MVVGTRLAVRLGTKCNHPYAVRPVLGASREINTTAPQLTAMHGTCFGQIGCRVGGIPTHVSGGYQKVPIYAHLLSLEGLV